MKQKKGIILLITLFFIITITTIYLENLSDSKKLVDNSQNKYNLNYTLKIVDDLNSIIEKLNKRYELHTESGFTQFFENLPDTTIPIMFKNIFINVEFEKLEFLCNINDIYNESENKQTCIDVFNNQNINIEEFKQKTVGFYNQLDNNISNYKQKDYIIDIFMEENYYEGGKNLKDNITFLDDTNSSNYLKCAYTININDIEVNKIDAIYQLSENEIKVKDIEISYK